MSLECTPPDARLLRAPKAARVLGCSMRNVRLPTGLAGIKRDLAISAAGFQSQRNADRLEKEGGTRQ